jgi:hypothetical protein
MVGQICAGDGEMRLPYRRNSAVGPLQTRATGQGRLRPVGWWRGRCTPSFEKTPPFRDLRFVPSNRLHRKIKN